MPDDQKRQTFGSMFHPNSAMGRADKATRHKAQRNRQRYMLQRKLIEQWARRGFASGAEESYREDDE